MAGHQATHAGWDYRVLAASTLLHALTLALAISSALETRALRVAWEASSRAATLLSKAAVVEERRGRRLLEEYRPVSTCLTVAGSFMAGALHCVARMVPLTLGAAQNSA